MKTVKRFAVVFLASALIVTAGCVTTSLPIGSGTKVTAEKPVLIASTSKPYGFGVLTHTWTYHGRTRDEVFVTFNLSGDSKKRPDAIPETEKLDPCFSPDGGLTWHPGLIPEGYREFVRHSGLIQMGEVDLRYRHWPEDGGQGNDARRTFTSFRMKDGEVLGGMNRSNLILQGDALAFGYRRLVLHGTQGQNGDLFLLAMGKHTDRSSGKRITENGLVLFRSSDNGANFVSERVFKKSDAPWGLTGPGESSICTAPNGDLLVVSRTGSGTAWNNPSGVKVFPFMFARSSDHGRTWSIQKLSFGGVKPNLLTMKNGIVALCYGRPGNHIVFSDDNGQSWRNKITLNSNNSKTSGYCDLVEVAPGRLFVCYDYFDSPLNAIAIWGGNEVNSVWGRIINVQRL